MFDAMFGHRDRAFATLPGALAIGAVLLANLALFTSQAVLAEVKCVWLVT